MSKKQKQFQVEDMEIEMKTNDVNVSEQKTFISSNAAPVFNNTAYSMFEGNGKYHVVSVDFNNSSLESGNVKIIESNTEKLIIQERLQVLLLGADFL